VSATRLLLSRDLVSDFVAKSALWNLGYAEPCMALLKNQAFPKSYVITMHFTYIRVFKLH